MGRELLESKDVKILLIIGLVAFIGFALLQSEKAIQRTENARTQTAIKEMLSRRDFPLDKIQNFP